MRELWIGLAVLLLLAQPSTAQERDQDNAVADQEGFAELFFRLQEDFHAAAQRADIVIDELEVKVIDGKTIEAGGRKIRLHGIDAPEMSSVDGWYARAYLETTLVVGKLYCESLAEDKYGRIVARCIQITPVSDDYAIYSDVGMMMIGSGRAIAYRRFLEEEGLDAFYEIAETYAQRDHKGFWKNYEYVQ